MIDATSTHDRLVLAAYNIALALKGTPRVFERYHHDNLLMATKAANMVHEIAGYSGSLETGHEVRALLDATD